MQEVRGILFDIGGVLYVGERPIEGAVELIARLQDRVKMRFLTNSTRRPPLPSTKSFGPSAST